MRVTANVTPPVEGRVTAVTDTSVYLALMEAQVTLVLPRNRIILPDVSSPELLVGCRMRLDEERRGRAKECHLRWLY